MYTPLCKSHCKYMQPERFLCCTAGNVGGDFNNFVVEVAPDTRICNLVVKFFMLLLYYLLTDKNKV